MSIDMEDFKITERQAQKVFESASSYLLQQSLDDIAMVGVPGSPIEQMFALAFGLTAKNNAYRYYEWPKEIVRQKAFEHANTTYVLESQVKAGPYFPDFQLTGYFRLEDRPTPNSRVFSRAIYIECDGRQFHHGSEKCAVKDKLRDRQILQDSGIPVIRFTGQEIHKDAYGCVSQAIDLLDNLVSEQSQLLRKIA